MMNGKVVDEEMDGRKKQTKKYWTKKEAKNHRCKGLTVYAKSDLTDL